MHTAEHCLVTVRGALAAVPFDRRRDASNLGVAVTSDVAVYRIDSRTPSCFEFNRL